MIEQIISLIAPNECINCKKEGDLLCNKCQQVLPHPGLAGCAIGARAATKYTGSAKELVARLKFERSRAAAMTVAKVMADRLPVSSGMVVCNIPTAPQRVRMRGYDQSVLIAKEFASLCGLPFASLLARQGQQRQLGQNRDVRSQQMRGVFRAMVPRVPEKPNVILIDDVITTGATLCAAADVLRSAGVSRIDMIVFASA
jgi:ComF family protein